MFTAILAGMGGLLPTLSRIGASFAAQPDQPQPHWHIVIPLAIFFVLGFILNFSFNQEKDFAKAVIIGIAAPGLITNIIAGISNAPVSLPTNLTVPSTSTSSPPATPPAVPASPPSRSGDLGWPFVPTFTTSAFAGEPTPQSRPILFSSSITGKLGYFSGNNPDTANNSPRR